MNVQAVQSSTNTSKRTNKFNSVKVTGYSALALGIASGVAGAKKHIKLHRYLAYAAGILAIWHTGIIEWYHHKRKAG